MSFKEFDLSEYVEALETFKSEKEDDVIKYWGSVEKFNEFIQKIRDDDGHIAELAVKQFGSVEKYTEAMKYNLEHFSELMEKSEELADRKDELMQKSDALFARLTSDLTRDVTTGEIQDIVREIIEDVTKNSLGVDMGDGYWDIVIESCSHDTVRKIYDKKYGAGASDYIADALRYYFRK